MVTKVTDKRFEDNLDLALFVKVVFKNKILLLIGLILGLLIALNDLRKSQPIYLAKAIIQFAGSGNKDSIVGADTSLARFFSNSFNQGKGSIFTF